MNTVNKEYAKTIMFNMCPFSKLHTNETLTKIENELENLYAKYKEGNNILSLYINQTIDHSIYYTDIDMNDEKYIREEDAFVDLINLCIILKGDDQYEYTELHDFYGNYKVMLLESSYFLGRLPEMVCGYIFLRKNNILDVSCEPDLNICGYIYNIYDGLKFVYNYKYIHDNDTENKDNKFYKNNKKVNLDDILSLNEGEQIIYKSDSIVFTKFSDQIIGIKYEKTDPLKSIHYAFKNENYLNEIIHLYDYSSITKLKPIYKEHILKFINNQKMIIKNVNIPNDLFNIVCGYIYDVNNIDREIETIDCDYKHLLWRLKYTHNDITSRNLILKYITKIINKCAQIDNKELSKHNRRIYRLSLISTIFKLLKTEKGQIFLKKYDNFNKVIEKKRKEFLEDIDNDDTENWFFDILNS